MEGVRSGCAVYMSVGDICGFMVLKRVVRRSVVVVLGRDI